MRYSLCVRVVCLFTASSLVSPTAAAAPLLQTTTSSPMPASKASPATGKPEKKSYQRQLLQRLRQVLPDPIQQLQGVTLASSQASQPVLAAPASDPAAAETLEAGKTAFEEGRYVDALDSAIEVLQSAPTSREADKAERLLADISAGLVEGTVSVQEFAQVQARIPAWAQLNEQAR